MPKSKDYLLMLNRTRNRRYYLRRTGRYKKEYEETGLKISEIKKANKAGSHERLLKFFNKS